MLIIPAIDIKNGKCVRLTQGKFDQQIIYNDDPLVVAKKWEELGATMIHLVDLDGAKNGKITNLEISKKIVNLVNIPIQIGGGIRDEQTVKQSLSLGFKRVVLGTIIFEDEELFKKLLKKFSFQIAVSLDVKNGKLVKGGWIESTNRDLIKTAKYLESLGVERFIYTDVNKDGTLTSPNSEQAALLLRNINTPVIISGGVSSLSDIKNLKSLGAEGVILGKALYEGTIDLKEALNAG